MPSPLTARALTQLLGHWHVDGPAYKALADRIRLLIMDGRIADGARLPAERELAEALDRSRTTIVSAYGALRDAGYLASVRGSGSVATVPGPGPQPGGVMRGETGRLAAAHGTGRNDDDEVASSYLADGELDLSKALTPAWTGLPAAVLRAAEGFDLTAAGNGMDLIGRPRLRELIAERFTRRGLPTAPEQIMVTVGAQSAMTIISHALLTPGDRVLVEQPSYPNAYSAIRSARGRLVGVPISAEGWDEAELEATFARVRPTLAYLMPDFQNPTGASMSPELRSRVIEWAARAGTVLMVDETTAEIDVDRAWDALPFAAYAERGDADHVITIGSLGKTAWCGLRLGWIRADERMLRRIALARTALDLGTPVFEQFVAAEVLGDFDAVLAERRAQLRGSRDLAVGMLRELMPEWSFEVPAGGISLWVNLGTPQSSALALAARSRGLIVTDGPTFGFDGAFERYLRVPFTSAEPVLAAGIERLAEVWQSLGPRATAPDSSWLDAVV